MSKPEKSNALQTQTNCPQAQASTTQTPMPLTGCLVRVGWMVLGNALLYLSVVFIVKHRGSFSLADVALGAVVAGCVGLRYLDIKYLKGQTASGEPGTLAHWRRYSLLLGAVALALCGVAHAIGYLFG